MTVPLIDISAFAPGAHGMPPGESATVARIARQVDEALQSTGFLAVTGHGVDPVLIHSMTKACKAFFDLPVEQKMQWKNPSGSISRGYVPFGGESNGRTTDGAAPPDAKEQIAFGRFEVSDEERRAAHARTAFEPNILPMQPDGFATTVHSYYRAMEGLAGRMLGVFAAALDQRSDFFADKFDHHTSVMRVLNYPDPTEMRIAPGQLRSGEHTDFGILTLLLADDAPGGLQVKLRHGGWIDVVPPPGSFVINIGDLMAVWTNDRWVSNLHRVAVPPMAPGRGSRRQSIAYFAHANFDALIECIPGCASESNPPRHAPVLAGEHRLMKVRQASMGAYVPG